MSSFKNSIFLIYFNHPHLVYLKDFYERLYGSYFKKIIYFSNCNLISQQTLDSPDDINYVFTYGGNNTHVIFNIFYQKYKDLLADSDGFMFAIDDCILNMKLLETFRNDTIIFTMPEKEIKPIEEHSGWQWDRPQEGKNAIYRLFQDPDYYNNFNIKSFLGCFSDRFYLPKKYITEKNFYLFHLFAKHHVFFELALPTVILAMENDITQYQAIKEEILWTEDRNRRFSDKDYLTKSLMTDKNFAIHPVRSHTYPIINEWLLELFK